MASFDLPLTPHTTDAISALIRARSSDFEGLDARVPGDLTARAEDHRLLTLRTPTLCPRRPRDFRKSRDT
ncbi:hypothetical protein PWG71_18090 [Nocardiopsis sp. N85]|uniref:hypothetical protein n=1 Tax=Nocardiopsis sp. N85 TaxID=3029400 RepID=UPI00237F24A3|nr:hypothetical protein [Nocardiopsis sp. N85]MDE3723307.1 hypothetical protein [Nocardiopsis sp. N85]